MRIIAPITFIVLAALVVGLSVCAPATLAENGFLKGFINHEILNILAVIVTITIASIATIHIWFNELEEKHGKKVFGKARREINSSAFWLLGLFLVALLLLIVRAYFENSPVGLSLFNGFALMILIANILILIDIMGVVKSLTPDD